MPLRFVRHAFVLQLLLVVIYAGAQTSSSTPLPLSPTPIMGWSSWNHYGAKITEADVRATADALVSSGLSKLGYTFVNIDGHWQGVRDANGAIQPNPATFGDMKLLGDYIHSKGLKYGIYSGPGPVSCGGNTTSYQHEDQDAATFASWGVDYLKYDLCSFRLLMKDAELKGGHPASTKLMIDAYKKMELALEKTHRPIYYALCQYGIDSVWTWAPDVRGTMWRTTMDIKDSWESMTSVGFSQADLSSFAGPGHYNDPDSLEVGNGHMTADEYRTHMSLWSIMAAPLILGNDVTKMDQQTLDIVGNTEVIAIDQDPLVKAGDRVWQQGPLQIWARPLKGGAMAVCLFNTTLGAATMHFKLSDLHWSGPANVRDVWAHQDLPSVQDSFSAEVPRHGVVMVILHR